MSLPEPNPTGPARTGALRSGLHRVGRALKGDLARWVLLPAAATAAIVAGVHAQLTPTLPDYEALSLSSEPLYSRSAAKPSLTLALSVEFPTVGAAYAAEDSRTPSISNGFDPAIEYVGYFDEKGCYAYRTTGTLQGQFERTGDASVPPLAAGSSATATVVRHTGPIRCEGDTFTGNLLNWATTSAIDILRLGLTGGDRVVDTADTTVLQRAVLPGMPELDFFNSDNFPAKILSATQAAGQMPGQMVPATGRTVVISNCLNRMYVGTQRLAQGGRVGNGDPISCTNPGANANLGTFIVRVQVCDPGDRASRPQLCHRYPSGSYKPVGNLQKHEDDLRVAVFGYLRDNLPARRLQRYGGVLRAPMKYVGPRHYDNDFRLAGNNAQQEWDPATGVFTENPLQAAEGVSGAVNYLNRFGRSGYYKRFDPIGELYYESLRYLQAKGPTNDGVAAHSPTDVLEGDDPATLYDNFPIYTQWRDPFPAVSDGTPSTDYSCTSNSILLIGDTHSHADLSIPGVRMPNPLGDWDRPANVNANEPDFRAWTNVVGAFESRSSVAFPDGSGLTTAEPIGGTRTPSNPGMGTNLGAQTFGDLSGYHVAGMAYWANTQDIRGANAAADLRRTGMRVTTYVIDVNEYGDSAPGGPWHHNNQLYLAAKYGGFDARQSHNGNPFYRRNPNNANQPQRTDDLWAVPGTVQAGQARSGDPRNYFLASQARQFLSALDTIFNRISKSASTISGSAISQRVAATEGEATRIYQASFDVSNWSGDLSYTLVTADASTGQPVLTPRDSVKASTSLAAQVRNNTRRIWLGAPDSEAIAFTPGNVATINSTLGLAGADAWSTELVRYLAGDDSVIDNAHPWRYRVSPLGDIINSGVVYEAHKRIDSNGRPVTTPTLYVGANDGMLHAFDAATLEERFAYIPSFVAPKMKKLADPSYAHEAFVDATPTVRRAQVNNDWKTVLTSGTGAGGQGVFALDVSDPRNFDGSDLLWEFTDADDPDLGNVLGRTQILRMRTGNGQYKWFAVFASGVNNYSTANGDAYPVQNGPSSVNRHGRAVPTNEGRPVLFFLDLGKPRGAAWSLGSNYYKISFDDRRATVKAPRGMIGFAATAGTVGQVKAIYAGDLMGYVWKIDFSKADNPGEGVITNNVSEGEPLFVATDPSASAGSFTPQPITSEPHLAYGPNGGLIVYVGTGKLLELPDIVQPTSPTHWPVQSVYALLDDGQHRIAGRSWLEQLAPSASDPNSIGPVDSVWWWGYSEGGASGTSPYRQGWYLDLPDARGKGERQITGFTIFGGKLLFTSVIPSLTLCSGSGYIYVIDQGTGSGTSRSSTVGVPGAPLVVTTVVGGKRRDFGLIPGSGSDQTDPSGEGRWTTEGPLGGGAGSRVISWREIADYETVRAKAREAAR